MQFAKQSVKAGVLMAALATATGLASAQDQVTAQQKQQPAATQQAIPDGPKPQTLPALNTITPVAPAIPDAPKPVTKLETAADGQQAVGDSLPSGPQPTAASQDDGPMPEIPNAGDGQKYVLRQRVNFVDVPFTVKDSKGSLVPGLTWRDVRVYENGARQEMKFFTTDPFPLSVAIVIDQSVTFDVMEKVNASLSALKGAFTPYDEVSLFTYASSVKKQVGFTASQSAALEYALMNSKRGGREPNMAMGGPMSQKILLNNRPGDPNTTTGGITGNINAGTYAEKEFHTLNDAILAAAQETASADRGRRRIVFVISDGKEYGSKAKEKDVIKYLQTNKVAVYATLVGDSAIPGLGFLDRIHLPGTMRDDVLPRYASATGGQCDPEFRPKGIEQSFAKITETVRTQYTVGYYSHESLLDSKFRKVEVRVMKPSLTVIAKEGYYPSARDSAPRPSVVPTATH